MKMMKPKKLKERLLMKKLKALQRRENSTKYREGIKRIKTKIARLMVKYNVENEINDNPSEINDLGVNLHDSEMERRIDSKDRDKLAAHIDDDIDIDTMPFRKYKVILL